MTNNSDINVDKDYNKLDMTIDDKVAILDELRKAMLDAAENLEFEKAAKMRDEISEFESQIDKELKVKE